MSHSQKSNLGSIFEALIPDVGVADQTQIDLFTSLGEMRSPFQGIAKWPWIDDRFAKASARLLKERGPENWAKITGGEYDKNGRPSLRSSSPIAAQVVQEAADHHGGFLWQDRNETGWAVRLGKQPTRDGAGRFAFCLAHFWRTMRCWFAIGQVDDSDSKSLLPTTGDRSTNTDFGIIRMWRDDQHVQWLFNGSHLLLTRTREFG